MGRGLGGVMGGDPMLRVTGYEGNGTRGACAWCGSRGGDGFGLEGGLCSTSRSLLLTVFYTGDNVPAACPRPSCTSCPGCTCGRGEEGARGQGPALPEGQEVQEVSCLEFVSPARKQL